MSNETKVDKVSELAQKPGEPRPVWLVRVGLAIVAWFRKPRSRIGLALAACVLLQGCATAAWHNYQVVNAERGERDQIEAGRIPLVKTNVDLVRENWFGYGVAAALDACAGVLLYRAYREWKDDGDTVYVPNVTNNYYPEPATETEATDEGTSAGE